MTGKESRPDIQTLNITGESVDGVCETANDRVRYHFRAERALGCSGPWKPSSAKQENTAEAGQLSPTSNSMLTSGAADPQPGLVKVFLAGHSGAHL